ncbi:MAG TPA: hypothetical protein VN643_26230 [Pyrinomonadaceae bacterium]|nr:hypothetical protein [Pyrinomonadaceae bacterium]
MKKVIALVLLLAAFGCTGTAGHSVSETDSVDAAIELNRKALEANADDTNAYSKLKEMLERARPEQVKAIRDLLHRYARVGKATLVSKQEPGDRLIVSGKVKSNAGHEVSGAVIYAFQTDSTGHYSRNDTMNEGNPRLFAYVKTGNDGSFEFETIRPAGYPAPTAREQDLIPQHIHLQVTAAGFEFRNLEFVFADDPRLTPYWKDWAQKRGHPILTVTKDSNGTQRGAADVVLQVR